MMALSDAVEMSLNLSEVKRAEINAKLMQFGGPTLESLAFRYSRRLATIMKRARVKNIEEYYLLKGALDGGQLTDSSLESKAHEICCCDSIPLIASTAPAGPGIGAAACNPSGSMLETGLPPTYA